jgi:hypothetical protein
MSDQTVTPAKTPVEKKKTLEPGIGKGGRRA